MGGVKLEIRKKKKGKRRLSCFRPREHIERGRAERYSAGIEANRREETGEKEEGEGDMFLQMSCFLAVS